MRDLRPRCRRRSAAGRSVGRGSARTAESVSEGRPQGEVRRGADGERPAGLLGAGRDQPPWVAASNASNGACPSRAVVVDGGVPPPHGSSGVTGASLPSASATPASSQVGERVEPAARSAPSRSAYIPASPPQAPSKAGCTLATIPQARSRVDRRPRRSSPRARAGAGTPHGGRAPARPPTAADGEDAPGRRRRRRCTWKPAWMPAARARPHVVDELPGLEAQVPGGPPGGRCRARTARRCASRTRRRRTRRPRRRPAPSSADDVQPAALGPLPPVADHHAGRAPPRPARRWRARSSVPDRSGPASSWTAPMPSDAAPPPQRGPLGVGAAARRQGVPGSPADGMVRVPGSGARWRPSRAACGPPGRRPSSAEDTHRGVDVHPGQVDRRPPYEARSSSLTVGRPAPPASGSRPSRGRAAGGRRRRPGPRARRGPQRPREAGRPGQVHTPAGPARSEVPCTCASTKAGVSSRPPSSTVSLRRAGRVRRADPGDGVAVDQQRRRSARRVHPPRSGRASSSPPHPTTPRRS